jgi:hypothetical protein
MALVFLAAGMAVWYFLPAQLARRQVRKIAEGTWTPSPSSRYSGRAADPRLPAAFRTDADKLRVVFLTTSLVGWGSLTSPAFMGCIAYLLEGKPFALGVTGVSVLLLLVTFPTRGRISQWLEEQKARVHEIRQAEGLPVPADPVDAEIHQLKERIAELEAQKEERGDESL